MHASVCVYVGGGGGGGMQLIMTHAEHTRIHTVLATHSTYWLPSRPLPAILAK